LIKLVSRVDGKENGLANPEFKVGGEREGLELHIENPVGKHCMRTTPGPV